jgi:vitamin B12 transporter
MTKIKKTLVLAGILACMSSYGQKTMDTLINMKEAVIISNRLQQFTPGSKILSVDSIALRNNVTNTLGDIISSQSQVQINNYGAGALSSPSFRGTGSAHTAILWNGFNLQDVLNGEIDFSQIPAFFLDDVKLQFGGCGALYGSGAIGGAINLSNDRHFNSGIGASLVTSYGSFASHFEGAECRIGQKEFTATIRAFNSSIRNDFDFINNHQENDPLQKLQNAETRQQGALIDNSILFCKNQKLSIHLWFQSNDHNIPALMNDTNISKQNEKNQVARHTVEWSMTGRNYDFFVRTGYFNNYKLYEDPTYNVRADYKSLSSISEFENNYKFNINFKLNTGCNYTHEKGESPNLDMTHQRDRIAIFSSLKYNLKNNNIKAVVSAREEIVNSRNNPLTYSFGIDGVAAKRFNIRANINKSYRIPSFNDLYWNDISYNMFGNPNLKNEEGLNEELSLTYGTLKKKPSIEAGITAFNSNVTNWILWQPNDDYSIWKPMNVDTVWSRGLEINFGFVHNIGNFLMKVSAMYTYLKTTDESVAADSTVRHKQLIYVPNHKAVANVYLEYKNISLSYAQNYTGDRYTTADNTDKVKSYLTGDFIIAKSFEYKNYGFSIDFHLNNAWNTKYEIMQFYPMPGRNYQLGLKLSFDKANS